MTESTTTTNDGSTDHEYWTFKGKVFDVVDGDTLDVEVDLGFRTQKTIRVRLAGLDTDEIFGVDHDSTEYERGMEQKRWVKDWLHEHTSLRGDWSLTIKTETESGKYGRWIARVIDPETGDVLNEDIIERFPHVESEYES